MATAYRTHTCGELRLSDVGKSVTLSGWVQIAREKNCVFIDLRDRHGITQIIVDHPKNCGEKVGAEAKQEQERLYEAARSLGRETVVQITGSVVERAARNKNRLTGDVEIVVSALAPSIAIPAPSLIAGAKAEATKDFVVDDESNFKVKKGAAATVLRMVDGWALVDFDGHDQECWVQEKNFANLKVSAKASGPKEVKAAKGAITVLSQAKFPPMKIEDVTDANEDTCMKWRFLDIRRPLMQERLMTRSKITTTIRVHLTSRGFGEVETPCLIKSTPEGARDFVVPTRAKGQFFALPQSPQTFKQLLMLGGMDRYFQIARCFRDEELRADRQPEFTQVDCEMSYVSRDDVLGVFEEMIRKVFRECRGVELPNPFPRLDYNEAMTKYGIDKPDLRYEMFLSDLTDLALTEHALKEFGPFKDTGLVIGMCVPGGSKKWSSGKALKALEKRARTEAGASSMVYVRCDCLDAKAGLKLESSAEKHFSKEELLKWAERANAKTGDLLCVFAGKGGRNADATREIVGKWRHIMGSELGLRPVDTFCPLWVVNFPLFEWAEEQSRWSAKHHPFTKGHPEDQRKINEAGVAFAGKGGLAKAVEQGALDVESLRADAYDLVMNGVEVGGGSIRISDRETQMNMFELLGFTTKQAEDQFGFLLNAFEYGTPPHGGLAFGLDRLCCILLGTPTIRDVMAFPKNTAGRDVMIDSPSEIAAEQYEELRLKLVEDAPKK